MDGVQRLLFVSQAQFDEMMKQLPQCEKLIEQCNEPATETEVCTEAQSFCNSALIGAYQ